MGKSETGETTGEAHQGGAGQSQRRENTGSKLDETRQKTRLPK